MANKTAQVAQQGPREIKVDIVSATVVDGVIVAAGAAGVTVSEATARNLLFRGKAVLAEGQAIDLTGPLAYGNMPSDADGDGIDDRLQAAEGDTGRGGPPSADGEPGSGKFDPTEPPEGAVSTVSSATLATEGLTPEQQAEAEKRKAEAAEAAAKEKEAQAAKAKADIDAAKAAPAKKAGSK